MPVSRKITAQMADAINDYAGVEVVSSKLVGGKFYRDAKKDGMIHAEKWEDGPNAGSAKALQLILQSQGYGLATLQRLSLAGYPLGTDFAPKYEIARVTEVGAAKSAIIIGALFGFAETGYDCFNPDQKAEMRELRFAIFDTNPQLIDMSFVEKEVEQSELTTLDDL